MQRSRKKIFRFLPLLLVTAFCGFTASGCAVKRWTWGTPPPQREASLLEPGGKGSVAILGLPTSEPSLPVSHLVSANFPTFKRQRQESDLSQPATEADLQKILTNFQRVGNRDTYRFPVPKDGTGTNVYKAALIRLQNYETTRSGNDSELLAFVRGRAYERLHDYHKALAQYQLARQSENGLTPEVTTALEALSRFLQIKQTQVTANTPVEYLQALDEQISAWQELQRHYAGTSYEILAREEEEQVDYAKVAFLELNRYRIEDGNESVILAYSQLITKHKESKNLPRYQLKLGDFYFILAQEYVGQHDPQSLHFDSSIFEELGRAALRLYAQVAQEDGIVEKQEAKGKLAALEAYMAKIGRLSR